MSKHTPGPFFYKISDGEFIITSSDQQLVGKACGQNIETDRANAQLFSNSPAMLELLFEIESEFKRTQLRDECPKLYDKILATIFKAGI